MLLDSNYNAKLGDFGFSLEMPSSNTKRTLVTRPFLTFSQGYGAPEVADGFYSAKSDVYSYGVVSNRDLVSLALLLWYNTYNYRLY